MGSPTKRTVVRLLGLCIGAALAAVGCASQSATSSNPAAVPGGTVSVRAIAP